MMKKSLYVFLFFVSIIAKAQQGLVKESLVIKSTALGKDVKFCIYLPSDYDKSMRNYPVLYLLHGYGDDETGWSQFGEVNHIADKTINSGEATPMIIAMPDGGVSWYMNSSDGKVMYEDFFINEFIPYIEKNFRIRTKKQYRAIAGLSMGGHGAMIMALKHPDLFSSCSPLSGAFFINSELTEMPLDRWNNVFGILFGKDLKGNDRITDHLKNNSGLALVDKMNSAELAKVRFYIDCGDDDFLIKGNMALHSALIDKKTPHEFRVRDGGHTWTYWRTALPEVLKFASESFHQK